LFSDPHKTYKHSYVWEHNVFTQLHLPLLNFKKPINLLKWENMADDKAKGATQRPDPACKLYDMTCMTYTTARICRQNIDHIRMDKHRRTIFVILVRY